MIEDCRTMLAYPNTIASHHVRMVLFFIKKQSRRTLGDMSANQPSNNVTQRNATQRSTTQPNTAEHSRTQRKSIPIYMVRHEFHFDQITPLLQIANWLHEDLPLMQINEYFFSCSHIMTIGCTFFWFTRVNIPMIYYCLYHTFYFIISIVCTKYNWW